MASGLLRLGASMRLIPLLVVALAPLVASAQTTLDISFADGTSETKVVGPDDCGLGIRASWQLSAFLVSCSDLEIWVTSGNCGSAPGDSDRIVDERQEGFAENSGEFNVAVADLPLFGTDAGTHCGDPDLDETFTLCGHVDVNNTAFCGTGDSSVSASTPHEKIRYDSLPPGVPVITRIDALDSALSVSVSHDSDTATVVLVATDPSGGETRVERSTSQPGAIRIGALTNDTTYAVTAQARDLAGNLSEPSAPAQGMPLATCGFLCAIVSGGSSETGGCSAGGEITLAALGSLAGIVLAARRRRKWR